MASMRIVLLSALVLAGTGAAALPAAAQMPSGGRTPTMTSDPAQMLRVAQRLTRQGEFSTAINFYRRVLELQPGNGEALGGLGDVLLALDSPAEALGPYRQWAALAPANPRPLLGQGRILNQLGRADEALPLLLRALTLGQPGPGLLSELGLAYDLTGQFRQAQTAYTQALTLAPRSPEVLTRFALSYALAGSYDPALKLLSTLAQEAGGEEMVRRPLALVYALSGQHGVAIRITTNDEARQIAESRRGFFQSLPGLSGRDRARAVHLGRLPTAGSPAGPQPSPVPAEGAAAGGWTEPGGAPIAPSPAPVLTPAPALAPSVSSPAAAPSPAVAPSLRPVEVATDDLPRRPPSLAPRVIARATRAPTPKLVSLPQSDDPLPAEAAPATTVAQPLATAPVAASAVPRGAPMPPADRVWVQLGLDGNRAQIERLWTRIAHQSRGSLDGVVPYVQPVLFNNKPVLRLIVGGFADASTAQALLARLKQAGLSGLVQRSNQAADPLFP